MTPKVLKVHLKHIKALKINSFVASIPPITCFIHNGMGVILNCYRSFSKVKACVGRAALLGSTERAISRRANSSHRTPKESYKQFSCIFQTRRTEALIKTAVTSDFSITFAGNMSRVGG
jgi:hypothetical protein